MPTPLALFDYNYRWINTKELNLLIGKTWLHKTKIVEKWEIKDKLKSNELINVIAYKNTKILILREVKDSKITKTDKN